LRVFGFKYSFVSSHSYFSINKDNVATTIYLDKEAMALPNFPQKPQRGTNSSSFPNDLISGQRQFYTQIGLVRYNSGLATGGGLGLQTSGTIVLPMPRQLNDQEVIQWEEWSGKDKAIELAKMATGGAISSMVAGLEAGGNFVSTDLGLQMNPFMFMMFRRPNFKEHTLKWTLAPNTRQESDTIKKIVNQLKRAALPTPLNKFVMRYPDIAMVSFKPDEFLFKLKPCAIISVNVDYTGGGKPSFFNSGAPTIVNLTLQLKEIQLWDQTNYQE
jgi:hypothetical protein